MSRNIELDPLEYSEEVRNILKGMGQSPIGTEEAASAAFTSAYAANIFSRHQQGASHVGDGKDMLTLATNLTSRATERIRPGTLKTVTKVALKNVLQEGR